MTSNLQATIDALGTLNDQIKEMEARYKALKQALDDLAPGAYEGLAYKLNISESERETPDKVLGAEIKAIVEKFKATKSTQYLTAHTNRTPVRTHKVTARTGKEAAA